MQPHLLFLESFHAASRLVEALTWSLVMAWQCWRCTKRGKSKRYHRHGLELKLGKWYVVSASQGKLYYMTVRHKLQSYFKWFCKASCPLATHEHLTSKLLWSFLFQIWQKFGNVSRTFSQIEKETKACVWPVRCRRGSCHCLSNGQSSLKTSRP